MMSCTGAIRKTMMSPLAIFETELKVRLGSFQILHRLKPETVPYNRRQTVDQRFPSHVVTKWLGNSVKVAEQFYLQVTDEHFQKALDQPEAKSEAMDVNSKQKPKQRACAKASNNHKKTSQSKRFALAGSSSLDEQVPVRGLEPPRGCPQWILNPSRLPIPPHRHVSTSRTRILIKTLSQRQVLRGIRIDFWRPFLVFAHRRNAAKSFGRPLIPMRLRVFAKAILDQDSMPQLLRMSAGIRPAMIPVTASSR